VICINLQLQEQAAVLLKNHLVQLRRAACGSKKGKKERGAADSRAPLFLSFGVGWGTHSTPFEKPVDVRKMS